MVYGFIGIILYLYVKCCVDYKWVISTDTFFLRRHTEILGLIAKCINGLDGYRILHNKNNATINSWKGLTPKISLLRLQSADSSKEHKTESPLKKK